MSSRDKGQRRERSRVGIALLLSLGVHLLLFILALPHLLAGDSNEGGIAIGVDYVEVTRDPPRKAPRPSLQKSPPRPSPQARQSRQPAEVERQAQSAVAPVTEEPAERLPGAADEPAGAPDEAVAVATDAGHPAGRGDSDNLTPGYGALQGSVILRPECMDGLDNDGDHLVDSEDPECLIIETPQEEAEVRSRALLLQGLRQNDLPEGDPDELFHERINKQLMPDGDDLVYQNGSFQGRIHPDGSISFGKARRLGLQGSGLSFDTQRRSRWRSREKLRFLEATRELRDEIATKQDSRQMKRALILLRGELNKIWVDRSLSTNRKKTILFERLDECDRDSEGGREAAKIIIDFIRAHSLPPRGKTVAAREEPQKAQ